MDWDSHYYDLHLMKYITFDLLMLFDFLGKLVYGLLAIYVLYCIPIYWCYIKEFISRNKRYDFADVILNKMDLILL